MEKNAKIYIAGHRGLVGSAICRQLEQAGFKNPLRRTSKELDLTNQQAVADFFRREKPDFIFLAAAKVGGIVANSIYGGEFIYQNLMIQTNILHQAMIHGVKRVLFLGSSCIYPKLAPQPMREDHLMTGPLEPTNSPYAVAKIAGIEMCWAYNRQYETEFIPVMPTNLYGPNDSYDLMNSHVLPAMIRKFHLAKLAAQGDRAGIEKDEARFGPIPLDVKDSLGLSSKSPGAPRVVLWGTGSPRREFLHVDDLAKACVFLMSQPWAGLNGVCSSSALELSSPLLLNIGMGQDHTIKDLAALVARVVGFSGEVVFDSSKPDGTPRKLLDVSRMEGLGWKAEVTLEEGIGIVYREYNNLK